MLENVQIRFRNKHMYTYHFELSHRLPKLPPKCLQSFISDRQIQRMWYVYCNISERISILYILIFLGGQDIILQLIFDLVRFDVILSISIEETNLPCRRHTKKSQNQPRLPQNLYASIYVYDSLQILSIDVLASQKSI